MAEQVAVRPKWLLACLALGVVAVGAFLRLYRLGNTALWYDELASIELASMDSGLSGIWQNVARWHYPHPPLFIVVLSLLFRGFPVSEFTARVISAFSGILAIPLLYRYVAELVGKRAGLVGALLLALSPYHVFYSQEARPYALSFSLVIVTWLVLRRALLKGGTKWWLAHTVCLTSLLYLHYFNACVAIGEFLYVFVFWSRHKQRLPGFVLSEIVACSLFLPALLDVGSGTVVLDRTPSSISMWATLMTMASGEVRYVTGWARATGWAAFALLLILGLIELRARFDVLALNLLPPFSAFLFVFVVLKVIGYIIPPYEERQFMPIFPFLLAIAASGGEYLLSAAISPEGKLAGSSSVRLGLRWGSWILLALCVLAIVVVDVTALNQYYFHFAKNADAKVAEYIGAQALPGDIVVCNSYSVATTLNFYGSPVPEYVAKPCRYQEGSEYVAEPCRAQGEWAFSEQLALFPDEGVRWTKTLADVLGHSRIWLVYLEGHGPERLTRELLNMTTPVSRQDIGPFTVWLLVPGER